MNISVAIKSISVKCDDSGVEEVASHSKLKWCACYTLHLSVTRDLEWSYYHKSTISNEILLLLFDCDVVCHSSYYRCLNECSVQLWSSVLASTYFKNKFKMSKQVSLNWMMCFCQKKTSQLCLGVSPMVWYFIPSLHIIVVHWLNHTSYSLNEGYLSAIYCNMRVMLHYPAWL